jgi:hypothetical protein
MYPSEMKNINQLKRNLSPELEEIRVHHIHSSDKCYRMYGGLASNLLSFENHIIELEIRHADRWSKAPDVTALQIATGWKDNKILNQATGYLVHLFKRRNNPGVVAQAPKSENRDKVDEFCSEFIAALKAAADTTNDEYLESIKGVFEPKSDD